MDRRNFLVLGGSCVAFALAPAIVTAVESVTFVKPNVNMVCHAGRIGQGLYFSEADILDLLGLDKRLIETEISTLPRVIDFPFSHTLYPSIEVARRYAETGAMDIYDRARLIIEIKGKLDDHFNFRQYSVASWMDRPNPYLQGRSFRDVMKTDLRHAATVLEFALSA